MLILLLAISSLVIVLFYFLYQHKQYWVKRGVPGPEPELLFGNLNFLGNAVRDSHPLLYEKLTKKYGKVFGLQRGLVNTLIISDQKMAHEMFFEKFEYFHGRDHAPLLGNEDYEKIVNVFLTRGLRWKRMRAVASTAFSGKSLRMLYHHIKKTGSNFVERLEEDVKKNGSIVDVKKNYHEYSGDLMFRVAFDQEVTRDFLQDFLPSVHRLLQMPGAAVQTLSYMVPKFSIFLFKIGQLIQVLTTNFKIVKFVIGLNGKLNKRRKEKKENPGQTPEGNTFMDIFLEYESDNIKLENNAVLDKRNGGQIVKQLSPLEVQGQIILFLFAGYDTVACTGSFISYFLAKNPAVQEKLRNEIFEICGQDEDPEYDQLRQLKYADAVLKETLRLVPIGSAVTSRKCNQDTTLGNLMVEKGTHVVLDVLTLHKDKEIWGEDAEEFRPERWLEEDSSKLNANFYGFGSGARMCVGMKLAYLEEKLALVKLLQRFRLHETPETEEAMQINGYVLTPKRVVVKLEHL